MREPHVLVQLARPECLRLLARAHVGRVVFTEGALPAIQPVNHMIDGGEVVFRTAGGGKLVAATRNAIVAFEVDEIDPGTRTGWSVVGVGPAYEVTDIERLVRLAQPDRLPWAPGRTEHTVAIDLVQLTGRRLVLPTLEPPTG